MSVKGNNYQIAKLIRDGYPSNKAISIIQAKSSNEKIQKKARKRRRLGYV